jgi:hypothetical protein
MSLRDGDTAYPHHPTTVPAGDYCKNNRAGDVWYLVVDEDQYGTAWDILNEVLQATSWHIHPAILIYVAQFILKQYIETSFTIKENIQTTFEVPSLKSTFKVAEVLDASVGVKNVITNQTFTIPQIQKSFTLREPIKTTFKITRVFNNTRIA